MRLFYEPCGPLIDLRQTIRSKDLHRVSLFKNFVFKFGRTKPNFTDIAPFSDKDFWRIHRPALLLVKIETCDGSK